MSRTLWVMDAPDYRNDPAFDVQPPGAGIGRGVFTHGLCLILGASLTYLWLVPWRNSRQPQTTVAKPAPAANRAPAKLPAEAPVAVEPFDHNFEDDVRVRPQDGTIFIHAGRGSASATPRKNGEVLLAHGYRGVAGGPVDLKRFRLLNRLSTEAKLQQAVGLSPEQVTKLRRAMLVPVAPEDRRAVREAFAAYATADDANRLAARQALLDAVRAAGERQGPLVAKWIAERSAILTSEQLAALLATEAE